MVIAMDEDLRLPGQQFGDTLKRGADRLVVGRFHGLPEAGDNPVFEEVVELPHQQRHIESPVKSDTAGGGRLRPLHLKQHQLIDRLTIERNQPGTIRIAAGFCQRQIPEILQVQEAGLPIVIVQLRDGDTGPLQMREHVGKGQFCNLHGRAADGFFRFLESFRIGQLHEDQCRGLPLQGDPEVSAIRCVTGERGQPRHIAAKRQLGRNCLGDSCKIRRGKRCRGSGRICRCHTIGIIAKPC